VAVGFFFFFQNLDKYPPLGEALNTAYLGHIRGKRTVRRLFSANLIGQSLLMLVIFALRIITKYRKINLFNPLSPSVHTVQLLLTDLHTFSYNITWKKLLKDQSNFPLVIILLILITFFLDYVLIL